MNIKKSIGWFWAKSGHAFRMVLCHLPSCIVTVLLIRVCTFVVFAGGTLDIHLSIVSGADETVDQEEVVENAYFVFDRSGSMTKNSEVNPGKTRYEELLRMFNETLESLPRSAHVYYLAFSGKVDPIKAGEDGNGFPIKTSQQRSRLFESVKKAVKPDPYKTLLYDAQAAMMTRIRKDMSRFSSANKKMRAVLYVYTDGFNETDGNFDAKYYSHRWTWKTTTNIWGKVFHEKIDEHNPKYYEECTNACKELWHDFSEFEEQKNDNITVERIFLADTKGLPDAERWRKKVVFQPVIDGDFSKLENPLAQDKQVVSSTLRFPMPDKRWKELEGKSALLCLKYGKITRSVPLVIKKGVATAHFDLSGITGANATVAELSLEKLPNNFTDFELKSPNPVFLTFPKTGTVMLSVEEPGLQSVKRIDEPIKFSAKCTEGASLTWTFSDNEIRQGPSFVRSFNTATNYRFTVKADKSPLDSLVLTGLVQVIEARVVVKPPLGAIVVEKEVQFLADARGAARGYDWYVNGTPVSGDGKTLRYTFPKSGEYKVQVQARYQDVLPAVSPEVVVQVKTAPRISIRSPRAYSGDHVANEEIELKAELEGGFDKVIWEIKGVETITKDSGVIHDEGSRTLKISTASVKLVKPGDYQIIAKAVGADGEKLSLPVSITVKRADIGIEIESPAEGHRVQNGKEEVCRAKITGKEISKIHWYAVDDNGKAIELGVADVVSGKSELAYTFQLDVGDKNLKVYASGLNSEGKELEEPVLSKPRNITSFVFGDVVLDMKDNLARVPYGQQIPLAIKREGAVTDVLWFMVEDGKESQIPGNGDVIRSPVVSADGKTPERMIDYFARGRLPGGGEVKSQAITLIHCCPPVSARIVLPMTNGVTITSIGKNVEYKVDLKAADGKGLLDVKNVVWEMDDTTAYTNRGNSVTHRYMNYGTYTIKVSGQCAKCGEQFTITAPASVVVKKQSAMAKFTVEPLKSAYPVRGWVKLKDQSTGDISKRVWRVLRSNGEEIFKYECNEREDVNYHVGEDDLRPDDLTFVLEVKDADGNAVKPCSVSIRVRYGWLAAGLFLVLGLMVIFAFGWVICGNGPKKWIVRGLLGPAEMRVPPRNDHDPECDYESYPNMISVEDYWNCLSKKAKIPSEVMAGISSDIEVVATSDDELSDAGAPKTVDDGGKPFTVERSGGAPYVSPGGTFEEHTSTRNDPKRFLFRDTSSYADAEHRYLRVHVDVTGEQPAVGAVVVTAIVAVFVLVGVFIASMKFAI